GAGEGGGGHRPAAGGQERRQDGRVPEGRVSVATGLDRLLADPGRLTGRRYGILAHGASISRDGRPIHLALAAGPAGLPSALFGPEHGYYGIEQDMIAAAGGRD